MNGRVLNVSWNTFISSVEARGRTDASVALSRILKHKKALAISTGGVGGGGEDREIPCPRNSYFKLGGCRSQRPRGLRHELPSPAPTLRSCVRIPLGAWMFICVLCLPRVEAVKNTSTVIPASRKRRQKGNPVVSGETVPADLREG
jgi:hypothetical protein